RAIENVAGTLESIPPFTVPPLSLRVTVTCATPLPLVAGVNVSVPLGAIVGATANSAGLSVETANVTVCVASSGGPALVPVATPETGAGAAPDETHTV